MDLPGRYTFSKLPVVNIVNKRLLSYRFREQGSATDGYYEAGCTIKFTIYHTMAYL